MTTPSISRRAHEDRRLFDRMEDASDPLDRHTVIERFLPLARSVAHQHAHGDVPLDDIFQIACFALIKAVDRYDPAQGTAFSSFAVPTMVGEIKRYYRDRTWSVRPPRGLQELVQRVDREIERARTAHGRAPSVGAIADRLGLTEEDVLDALEARPARSATSLDVPVVEHGDGSATLGDMTGAVDPGFSGAENRADLEDVLRFLSERERTALRLRFHEGRTQQEIGEVIGVSQMQVSRILRGALERARLLGQADTPAAQADAWGGRAAGNAA
jgi:RNA polymerase sigma-B factor